MGVEYNRWWNTARPLLTRTSGCGVLKPLSAPWQTWLNRHRTQHRIKKRNYGTIVEQFAEHLATMEEGPQRDDLAIMVANHMKRDLSNWSTDSMSDEKVADDMAHYTDGKIQLDIDRQPLISDGELLSTRVATSLKKKKKK